MSPSTKLRSISGTAGLPRGRRPLVRLRRLLGMFEDSIDVLIDVAFRSEREASAHASVCDFERVGSD